MHLKACQQTGCLRQYCKDTHTWTPTYTAQKCTYTQAHTLAHINTTKHKIHKNTNDNKHIWTPTYTAQKCTYTQAHTLAHIHTSTHTLAHIHNAHRYQHSVYISRL